MFPWRMVSVPALPASSCTVTVYVTPLGVLEPVTAVFVGRRWIPWPNPPALAAWIPSFGV